MLDSPYPEPDIFLKALNRTSRMGREILASLFLTEGVPVAFIKCPPIYELLRKWLGEELNINTKQITLLGSARIGYSLSPRKFGKEFGVDSDLDLSIVANNIFEKLKIESNNFINDYRDKKIAPKNDSQRHYWEENIKFIKKNLSNGFIDVNKIPYIKERYPEFQYLGNLMWRLKEKLHVTPNAPNIKRASLRVYDTWNSLINRVSFNFNKSRI